ncbi:hypothetical protein [Flavisericum labens]|uniref:hypothetical protein n=1 Tax=Flavisericum labens TaxID=3377112 RepID=UPI00387B2C60
MKIILIITLGAILYQDVKERLVYWFLFPMVALCLGMLFYSNVIPQMFFASVFMNLIFIAILLLVVLLYSKIKLKTKFNTVFGSGDIVFFLAMVFSFSTITFMILFISALIFSLVLHLVVKNKQRSVPLAGYMSLFFGLVYLGYWSGIIKSIYRF